jgi:hypothetical protein
MNHITEEAELYALGLLEEPERRAIDEHLAICDACTRRIARAEATVLTLVEATTRVETAPQSLGLRVIRAQSQPASRMPARRAAWIAVAAAALLAVSVGALAQQHVALVATIDGDNETLSSLVHSHFEHAQFVAPGGAPIEAKVLYERHGAWYEIIAAPGSTQWSIAVTRRGAPDLILANRFVARGDAVFMRFTNPGVISQLELRDGSGHVLGVVKPLVAREVEDFSRT